ncbi:MAG: PAS domain-containing protein, partial [Hyphomicrobiales bacterium]|nr:PAS domain-containing protein [Hyphomicrobiales bacterium]
YDSVPIGLALLDRELRFVRINRVLAEINGFTVAEHLGRYVFDVVPGLRAAGEPLLRQVLETGQPLTGIEFSGQTAAQPGVQRAWVEQFYPLKAHDGTVQGLGIVCEEVTGKARSQFEQAHLAAIIEAATDAIISTSADARLRSWNPAAEQMFGYTAAEAIGSPANLLVPPESGEPLHGIFAQVMAGEKIRREAVRRRKDGVLIPVALSASPMRDETGRIVATTVMFRDISEQKRREEHTRFLMRELSHRSKNLLAVIQAMARQTARSSQDLDDFQRRFTARVMGLAQSHDLLVKEDWRGAPVGELVRAQLAPFIDPDDGRLKLSGPPLLLRPEAAQNIGLALHELATNASKHGALSSPSGRIAIQWELAYCRPDDARFRMTWQESGGPLVNVPATHGFGHTVVEAMVGRALDGEAHIDWAEKGLTWRLDVPATCVASGPASDLESAKQD